VFGNNNKKKISKLNENVGGQKRKETAGKHNIVLNISSYIVNELIITNEITNERNSPSALSSVAW
jgi:hypothetical protein